MQTAYIYSASRVATLGQFLLNRADIERLLVAAPGEDLTSALKETYLAPYLIRAGEDSMPGALELTLIDAKELLMRVAPEGSQLRFLWVQYDVHNLRVLAKARAAGLEFVACRSYFSHRGNYDPEQLADAAERSGLDHLEDGWQHAFDHAVRYAMSGELDRVDGALDVALFATIRRIASAGRDPFLQRYVAAVLDMYNLRTRLRLLANPAVADQPNFVSGGTLSLASMETVEQVIAAFEQLRGDFFTSALAYYSETGNTTQLDARCDEYLLTLAGEASVDLFSAASLVRYYLACRQAAANVRTIVVGRTSGMRESDIRANLRLAYVNA